MNNRIIWADSFDLVTEKDREVFKIKIFNLGINAIKKIINKRILESAGKR